LFGGAGALAVAAIVLAVINTGGEDDPRKLSKETTRTFIAPPVRNWILKAMRIRSVEMQTRSSIIRAEQKFLFLPIHLWIRIINQ